MYKLFSQFTTFRLEKWYKVRGPGPKKSLDTTFEHMVSDHFDAPPPQADCIYMLKTHTLIVIL